MNRTKPTKKDEELIARRLLATQQQVDRLRKAHNIPLEHFFNLDEKSLRLFCTYLRTLDYKGRKDVALESKLKEDKFNLSLSVIWLGSGKMDIFVQWHNTNKETRLKKGEVDWTEHNGIWFAETASKMTQKAYYVEVVQQFVRQHRDTETLKVFLDDCCPGHGGLLLDKALMQEGIHRVRIGKSCTSLNQVADQAHTNQTLERLALEAIHDRVNKSILEGIPYTSFKSMTEDCRDAVGEILSQIVKKWNNDEKLKEGVRKTFRKCYGPDTSELKQFSKIKEKLDLAKRNGWEPLDDSFGSDPSYEFECINCGHRSKDKKADLKHGLECWNFRDNLQAPKLSPNDIKALESAGLTERIQKLRPERLDLNNPSYGLLFSVETPEDESTGRRILGVLFDRNRAFGINTGKELEGYWWHDCKLTY